MTSTERRDAEALLQALCAPLQSPGCAVEWEVISWSPPARILIERARDSDGLVVGTRGRNGFAALLLGSLSQTVSVRPPCPITVVPAVHEPFGKVVVGGDTSASARVALVRAAEEPRLRGAVLEAVMVRKPPELPAEWSSPQVADGVTWIGTTPVATPGLVGEAEKQRQDVLMRWRSGAERRLDREISTLPAGDHPYRIERLVISGTRPAELLLQAASRADLLVVGSRGRGSVTGRLFGSVSHQCMRHATLMVVPSTEVAAVRQGVLAEPQFDVLAAGRSYEGRSS